MHPPTVRRVCLPTLLAPALLLTLALGLLAGCQGEDESKKSAASAASGSAAASSTPLPPGANNPGLPGNPPPTPAPTAIPPSPSPSATPAFTLTIGYRKGVAGIAGVVAVQQQWFERYGLGVRIQPPLIDSTQALNAMAIGTCDVLYGISIPALIDANQRTPGAFRIVGFTIETTDSLSGNVLVPKGSTARTLDDLRGKRIAAMGSDFAVPAASLLFNVEHDTTTGLARGATRHRVIDLDFPSNLPRPKFDALYATEGEWARQTLPALPAFGRPGDAPSTATTISGAVALRPLARVSLAQRFGSPFPVTAVVIREELLRTNPEQMAVFLRANNELLHWCVANGAEALPALQKMLALDDEAALNLFLPRTACAYEVSPAALDRAALLWGRYTPAGEIKGAKLSPLIARLPVVYQKLEPTPIPRGAAVVPPGGSAPRSAATNSLPGLR